MRGKGAGSLPSPPPFAVAVCVCCTLYNVHVLSQLAAEGGGGSVARVAENSAK